MSNRHSWLSACGVYIFLQLSVCLAGHSPSLIGGPWYADIVRSDDFDKYLLENMRYIDLSAIKFVSTRSRNVLLTGNYRRRLNAKQIAEIRSFIDAIVPLDPIVRIEQSETGMRFFYPGNRIREIRISEADLVETRQTTALQKDHSLILASWEEGTLIIETNTTSGVSILEKIGLDNEAEAVVLRVEMTIDTPKLPKKIILNRYYTPYPLAYQ
ncbi:MAG TPA: hypothetical protein VGL10_03415 [Gammaproteobacteria bacterium]